MRLPKFLGRVLPADPTSDVALDRFERARKFEAGAPASAALQAGPASAPVQPTPETMSIDELLTFVSLTDQPVGGNASTPSSAATRRPALRFDLVVSKETAQPLRVDEARKARRSWLTRKAA